jgi:hypothetical protein
MYLGIGWLRRYLAKAVANMRAFSMGEKRNARVRKETRVPPSACPGCGSELDCASDVIANASPEPGDVTICLTCGLLMRFKDDMRLRRLTGVEMIEALQDPRVALIESARQMTMAVHGSLRENLKRWEPPKEKTRGK